MEILGLGVEIQPIFDSIVSSYEDRLESITSVLLDAKSEIGIVNSELRERLSRFESLRKKDFDRMMQGILSAQDERELEVRSMLRNYLQDQQEMIRTMKDKFTELKKALSTGEAGRIAEFQEMMKKILTRQDERRTEVISILKEFQREQGEMVKGLKDLLAKGRDVRINDLKTLLKEFRLQQEKRIAGNQERRIEVRTMLDELSKGR
ncbi:MAG: hypothetical protein HZA08_07525 [Nitrospirae bacterium]|nr:hypothetical protein [Nitrospirota bacterium]